MNGGGAIRSGFAGWLQRQQIQYQHQRQHQQQQACSWEWGILAAGISNVKTYKNLFEELYSWENLEDAYWKARKRKANSPKVQEFEKHWQLRLVTIMRELPSRTYRPQPLKTFVLRDPKTRVICVSEFRDRVVHHALVNILQPIFQPRFIYDSYASQKGKGTLPALERFDVFIRKISKNGRRLPYARNANMVQGFVLKADIRHYFDTVDQAVLLRIISKRVKDKNVLWLVKVILDNYNSGTPGKGMPLGNWTSQFFANVYLNELDQFVKHKLPAKYYIRYVDDFVILDSTKAQLQYFQQQIKEFLKTLNLELHPTKCKIIPLGNGVSFLGFRVFYHYKRVRAGNVRKIKARFMSILDDYEMGLASAHDVIEVMQGWNGHAMHGNTYRLRQALQTMIEKELRARTANRRTGV